MTFPPQKSNLANTGPRPAHKDIVGGESTPVVQKQTLWQEAEWKQFFLLKDEISLAISELPYFISFADKEAQQALNVIQSLNPATNPKFKDAKSRKWFTDKATELTRKLSASQLARDALSTKKFHGSTTKKGVA